MSRCGGDTRSVDNVFVGAKVLREGTQTIGSEAGGKTEPP